MDLQSIFMSITEVDTAGVVGTVPRKATAAAFHMDPSPSVQEDPAAGTSGRGVRFLHWKKSAVGSEPASCFGDQW